MIQRIVIQVRGIVQGVGFRPFVYNKAIENDLSGWVNNSSQGVTIDIEGERNNINKFLNSLKNDTPNLAKITKIELVNKDIKNYKGFLINYSNNNDNPSTIISPDIATCDKCKRDILDKTNKRYRYPFTNCTNCGPRLSIIEKLPYDREVTTMSKFKMCNKCKSEYEDPTNRRFHAQPNACEHCGPKIWLVDKDNKLIKCDDVIKEAISIIKSGEIIAIKGIGGFHLVCDGKNSDSILKLRKRKSRPNKPLAVMIKDVESVRKYCIVNKKEEKILNGNKKPILILNKKSEFLLPYNLTNTNKTLGVMLPYTPLHLLLFEEEIEVLVMTSANISGQPIIYKNDKAISDLNNIVDYFLMHDRDIYLPVDDSICKVVLNEERVIRPGRGYSPITLEAENIGNILGCGSHLKNTFSMSNGETMIMSQYIGDMENAKTYYSYEKSYKHFSKLYKLKPDIIAYDLHPDYWCNDFVEESDGIKIPVQHHHAHIASCLFENNINEEVIGVAFDGSGYGDDGHIWGGEFLICDTKDYSRIGYVNYINLPGGESAVKEPWRSAIGYLYKTFGNDYYKYLPSHFDKSKAELLISMIKNNINSPLASSIGRLFDAVAAFLGFYEKVTFEGEAAIYLENIAADNIEDVYKYSIDKTDKGIILNTNSIIISIICDIRKNINKSIISKKFHNTIIKFTVDICSKIRSRNNINKVALSGGVFNNNILTVGIVTNLKKSGFYVFTNKLIPNNDSGISTGQVVIANSKIKEEKDNVYCSTCKN